MPSEAKIAAVEDLKQFLEGASSIFLTDFTGMPVEMMSDLRRKCREADVDYRVVKDSLTRLAAKAAGVEDVIEFIEGPTGLALGHEDQLAPARVLSEFAKEHKLPRLKAAFLEGKIFGEEEVKKLAALPSREVLVAQFAMSLNSPLGGFVGALNQVMWKLVATIDSVAKSISDGGPAGEPAAENTAGSSGEEDGGATEGESAPEAEAADGSGAESGN